MSATIVLSGRQHARIMAHLFPGDGLEAAAMLSCRAHISRSGVRLLTRYVDPVPYERCRRSAYLLQWDSSWTHPLLERAERENLLLVKVHSHPGGWLDFSEQDDRSDRDLFPAFHHLLERGPHGSVVAIPDGRMTARMVGVDGSFDAANVNLVGDDIRWYGDVHESSVHTAADRFVRAFGEGTYRILRQLRIAVVGCSGTGSLVIEQALRCMVGELVLVDPDVVSDANLNRMPNTFPHHIGHPKPSIFADVAARLGFSTKVDPRHGDLRDPDIVRAIADCDVLFGCVDSIDGRYLLNRIAAFYMRPYFDLGANIDVESDGSIAEVSGAVHYLQPDGSSLLSRRVFTLDQVRAAMMLRDDPEEYQRRRAQGYIHGLVTETRPAVLPLNMRIAADAFLEFLARIHPYRLDENSGFASRRYSLRSDTELREGDGEPCSVLARHAGRGEVEPLLDLVRYG